MVGDKFRPLNVEQMLFEMLYLAFGGNHDFPFAFLVIIRLESLTYRRQYANNHHGFCLPLRANKVFSFLPSKGIKEDLRTDLVARTFLLLNVRTASNLPIFQPSFQRTFLPRPRFA